MSNTLLAGIRGVIFDYGGTLDTRGDHWSHILRQGWERCGIKTDIEQFRRAYVYAERALAAHRIITPEDDFLTLLRKKVLIELCYHEGLLPEDPKTAGVYDRALEAADDALKGTAERIAVYCNNYARACIDEARPVLEALAAHFPMVLVSNFYGNVDAVLRGMDIRQYFAGIIESAVVGIRKPDARIYALGVMALPVTEEARAAGDTCDIFGHESGAWLRPESVLVVGDSLSKDIYPARSIGCRTAWIKGRGWTAAEDEASDPALIPSLSALMP